MPALEIVTDASTKKYDNGRTFGCAGALCINNGETNYMISQDSTNNRSELLGVYLGVVMAKQMLNENPTYDDITLYSDSQFAIYGINKWMQEWIQNQDSNGILRSTSGKAVKNQELFIVILRYITDNKLKIKFRHCLGHIRPTPEKLTIARDHFRESNGYDLRPEDIYKIEYYNNIIDEATRDKLNYINPDDYPILDYSGNFKEMAKFVFPKNYTKYIG